MLPGTSERSQRHTFLHVSFSNSLGLASVHPLSTGFVGCAENLRSFSPSRTKRQVNAFQYVLTLFPPTIRLGLKHTITMDSSFGSAWAVLTFWLCKHVYDAKRGTKTPRVTAKVNKNSEIFTSGE